MFGRGNHFSVSFKSESVQPNVFMAHGGNSDGFLSAGGTEAPLIESGREADRGASRIYSWLASATLTEPLMAWDLNAPKTAAS